MSYGKYGMKNIGGVSPSNMMGIAYNDPGFALGALIAQNYNKNWEDRGNQKAIDAALASLSPTGNAQEQQLATQQFQSMQPQEGTLQGRNMLGIGAGYTIPTGKGLLGEGIPASTAPTGQAAPTGTGLFGSMLPPTNAPNAREMLGLQDTPQGTGLFGSVFPPKLKDEAPKQGLFASVFPEPEKDLKERLLEDSLAKGGLLSNGLLLHKLWEADQQKKNSSGRQLLGLESTDGPSARELLGLQDAPEGTGLLSSILPPKETKEEPEGGLLTNAMINYHLNGPGSSVENTSSQILKDYLGDYSLGKDAEGNTVLNKSQGIGDIAQGMADQRLQNFDADRWMADTQLNLMKQGYPPEQIERIMGPLAQKAAGIQKQQYEAKAGEAIDQFFKLAGDGKYDEANAVLYKATQYAPDMINKILSGSVAPKDIYATQTGRENLALQHGYNLDTLEQQYQYGEKKADSALGRQKDLTSFTADVKRHYANAAMEDKVRFLQGLGIDPKVIQAAVTGVGKSSTKQVVSPQYKAASDYVRSWQAAHKNDTDTAWQNDPTYQTAMTVMQAGFMPEQNATLTELSTGVNSMIKSLSGSAGESEASINAVRSALEKYKGHLTPEQMGNINQYLDGANAIRELRAGYTDQARKYAGGVDLTILQRLGITKEELNTLAARPPARAPRQAAPIKDEDSVLESMKDKSNYHIKMSDY